MSKTKLSDRVVQSDIKRPTNKNFRVMDLYSLFLADYCVEYQLRCMCIYKYQTSGWQFHSKLYVWVIRNLKSHLLQFHNFQIYEIFFLMQII